MYYYAALRDTDNGKRFQGVYTPNEYHTATFSPETETVYITGFKVKSKDEARQLAIDLRNADCDTVNDGGEMLSYNEISIIYNNLERIAKQFGLVREFKNEGII